MSVIGPIDSSLVQAAQAQETASKARDRERAVSDRTQRYTDQLDMKAAGVESADAVRQLPQNDSEQAAHEHEAKDHRPQDDDDDAKHIDVTV